MATRKDKKPTTPHGNTIGKTAAKNTKFIKLDNRPLKELLYYLTDDAFIEARISRTEPRHFSAHIILSKKKH
jgi:hypothetical protein